MTESAEQRAETTINVSVSGGIVVKRYPNRKLYDTTNSRYVNLEQLADLVRQGVDVRVIEHTTGEDLTSSTLSQIAFNEERRKRGGLSTEFVRKMIQTPGAGVQELVDKISPLLGKADTQVDALRDEIEQHVRKWIEKGTLTVEEGNQTVKTMWEQSLHSIESIQQTMDQRVAAAVDRIVGTTAVRTRVDELLHRIDIVEKRFDVLEDKLRRVLDRLNSEE